MRKGCGVHLFRLFKACCENKVAIDVKRRERGKNWRQVFQPDYYRAYAVSEMLHYRHGFMRPYFLLIFQKMGSSFRMGVKWLYSSVFVG